MPHAAPKTHAVAAFFLRCLLASTLVLSLVVGWAMVLAALLPWAP